MFNKMLVAFSESVLKVEFYVKRLCEVLTGWFGHCTKLRCKKKISE